MYASEKKACLTLEELEGFIGKWIIGIYHNQLHRGIQMSPLKKFNEGFSGLGGRPLPPVITDTDRLQRDFMPMVYRTIQRTGVEINNVHYYGSELQRWIGCREEGKTRSRMFSFARDPRDISRIFFLAPDDNEYREIPYLDTSRGPISLWELRSANEKLKEEGRREINEHLLFEKHFELLDQARSIVRKSKAARKKMHAERKRAVTLKTVQPVQDVESVGDPSLSPELVEPFDDQPVLPYKVERL